MSERTAQCRECTDVFECGPTGRLPVLCPKCRKDGKERAVGASKPRKVKASSNGMGNIQDAVAACRAELEAIDERKEQLEEAIEALEKLVA
jgi:hypothetical protein